MTSPTESILEGMPPKQRDVAFAFAEAMNGVCKPLSMALVGNCGLTQMQIWKALEAGAEIFLEGVRECRAMDDIHDGGDENIGQFDSSAG